MDTGCRMWRLGGFLFTAAAGTLLHFAYGWSGENPVVGAFSAVSESTWEHMKLLFVPLLLTALFAALAVLFVWWTYAPPHLPLFMDPVTGQYGI